MADKVTALATRDPMDLLSVAVEKGASVETVERLVALAERMQATKARIAWHEAMASFRTQCPPIRKDKKASIQGERGSFEYSYASLPAILASTGPTLKEHGLSPRWRAVAAPAGNVGTECIVSHAMGHEESSGPVVIPIGSGRGVSPAQQAGIAHTYAERYALKKVLGLAPDDDTDGAGDHGVDTETGEVRESPPQRHESDDPWLVCPLCQKKTLMKSKVGAGYYCFPKRGGCGKQVADPAPEVPF